MVVIDGRVCDSRRDIMNVRKIEKG